MLSWKQFTPLVVLVLVLLPLLVACGPNQATTTASCAFVVGDGLNGRDANLHRIIYPGQTVRVNVGDTVEKVTFVPCNSRNYIINKEGLTNANNEPIGDRHELIVATIPSSGQSMKIAATAYWTLNQSDQAMRHFYEVCFKYQCASSQDIGGDANFSTKGWNGMLGENFGPALDRAARIAVTKVDPSVWEMRDPNQIYQVLGDEMSANFADVIRATLGYPEDLFCGSGNSNWKDASLPGEGEFICTPVRIAIDNVEFVSNLSDPNSPAALTYNEQRLRNAQALYGEGAGYWLGVQDTVDKCKTAGTTCVIAVGGGNSVSIAVPANNPAPVPVPAPTPEEKKQ